MTLKSGSKSFNVIVTDTCRSATYDFLLTFHSNYGPSRTVSEINGDFTRKLPNFPTPCILRPRWLGSPWNWVLHNFISPNW